MAKAIIGIMMKVMIGTANMAAMMEGAARALARAEAGRWSERPADTLQVDVRGPQLG